MGPELVWSFVVRVEVQLEFTNIINGLIVFFFCSTVFFSHLLLPEYAFRYDSTISTLRMQRKQLKCNN